MTHLENGCFIIKTYPGCDGGIRTYTVRLPNGAVNRRAVQLICPFEFSTLLSPDEPRLAKVGDKYKKSTRRCSARRTIDFRTVDYELVFFKFSYKLFL